MAQARRGLRRVATALAVLGLVFPALAQADVAYVGSDNEIWISTLDGAVKERLSDGEGDWREVAQSDTGWVVGIRREAGKVAQLASFRVWNPQGGAVYNGPLAGELDSAYPLGLDLTNDGRGIIYGFSRFQYGFPVGTLTRGHYFLPSETVVAPALGPYKQLDKRYPTLVGGSRVIATGDEATVLIQDTAGTASEGVSTWPGIDVSGATGVATPKLRRTDVAANGKVIALEILSSAEDDKRIGVIPVAGLGGAPGAGDCYLATTGLATQPSLAQDGASIAWQDADGVKVGGIPDFSGAEPCVLTRPAVLVAAGASMPSLGAMSAAEIRAARTPAATTPPAKTTPSPAKATPPASLIGRTVSLRLTAPAVKAGRCPARARVTVTAGKLRASRLVRVVRATVKGKRVCRVIGRVALKRVPPKRVRVRVVVSGKGLRTKAVIAKRV